MNRHLALADVEASLPPGASVVFYNPEAVGRSPWLWLSLWRRLTPVYPACTREELATYIERFRPVAP